MGRISQVVVKGNTDTESIGKAEDSAHTSGDYGVMALAVRNDVAGTLANADADYAPLQVDATGALRSTGAFTTNINGGTADVFARTIVSNPFNDVDIQFFKAAPDVLTQVTTANSATAAQNVGGALFSSSTNANGSVQAVTTEKTTYSSGSEIYVMFTAAFTAGIASSYMRLGLYDANDGLFIGYEGTSFGVTYRNNTSDTTVAKGSFSEDTLTGAAGSQFTRAGTPEAIDLTKLNVYRIRFGWLGSAPVYWEVMAPDGNWVTFHKTLFPNLQGTPSIRNPNLPVTLDITKTAAAATDITIQTDCWGAGTTAGNRSATADEFAFQTYATLTNGSSYDSGILALSPEFSQVHTAVLASHDGTITISWYRDAAGTDTIRTLTIPYTAANGYQLFAAPAFSPYNRYVFLNDSGSNQTDFYFDTKFMRRPISPQILRVDGPVVGGMVAQVNRALITAYDGTNYINVNATNGGNLKVSMQEISDGLDVGAGNAGAETQRVSISTDDVNLSAIKTAIEIMDDWDETNRAKVNPIVGQAGVQGGSGVDTALTQRVTLATDVALPAGTNAIGKLAANSGVDIGDVDILSIAAGSNLVGDVGISGARTSGGTTFVSSLGTSTLTQIKGSAGQLYWLHVINLKASVLYLQIFNLASASVTLGTTTPDLVFPLLTSGDTNGAGFVLSVPSGIAFGTGISWAITTTETGATTASANEAYLNAGYA